MWTTDLTIFVNIYGYCAKDKLNHNTTFNLYLSNNSGITWEFYESLNPAYYEDGVGEFYYHWPKDWHENGDQYKLKIEINSTSGFSIHGVSNGTFTLNNAVIKKNEPTSTIR